MASYHSSNLIGCSKLINKWQHLAQSNLQPWGSCSRSRCELSNLLALRSHPVPRQPLWPRPNRRPTSPWSHSPPRRWARFCRRGSPCWLSRWSWRASAHCSGSRSRSRSTEGSTAHHVCPLKWVWFMFIFNHRNSEQFKLVWFKQHWTQMHLLIIWSITFHVCSILCDNLDWM